MVLLHRAFMQLGVKNVIVPLSSHHLIPNCFDYSYNDLNYFSLIIYHYIELFLNITIVSNYLTLELLINVYYFHAPRNIVFANWKPNFSIRF